MASIRNLCQYNVVVIGGGISGLAAIQKLITSGEKNCVLLEAQSYLGGRVKTTNHRDHYLEYGAQWVHGEDGNAVYALAKERCLLEEEKTFKQTGLEETIFIREDSSPVEEEIIKDFTIAMANLREEGVHELIKYKESCGNYYTNKFPEVNKWGNVGLELLDWYGRFRSCIVGTDSWFDESGINSVVSEECPGNQVINWKKGFHSIIDLFKEQTPEDVIFLNSPVKTVFWNSDEGKVAEKVTSKRIKLNLYSDQEIFADYVIFTPSLAVLKETHNTLFQPKLPEYKIKAIESLGIGIVDKIYMEFPTRWWGDCDGFSFMRKPQNYDPKEDWPKGILGFYEVYKQPFMLCAWITGKEAKEMEKSSVDEVKEACMQLMRSYLSPHYEIPDPVWCDRSEWGSNPFIQGSYSYRSVDTEIAGVTADDLASPLCASDGSPVVCFAGEATHSTFFSTVHAAVESGWREAHRILAHVRPRISQFPEVVSG